LNNTVYVLGAGANRAETMTNFQDVSSPSKAPLGSKFFLEALKMAKFNNESYTKKMEQVYAYIKTYWKIDKHKLATSDFDLEECFTLLESQYIEAKHASDNESIRNLFTIQFRLKRFLAEILSSQEGIDTQSAMRGLGQIIWEERPIVITFNYDCFLERSIEYASHLNPSRRPTKERKPYDKRKLTEEELKYSHWNWNRPLGYSIKFDEVMVHDGFIHHHLLRRYESGERFYSLRRNKLYSWYILKLHGSINWFRYIPEDLFPQMMDVPKQTLSRKKKSHIILGQPDWSWKEYPERNGWPIDPILIPPLLHKDEQFRDPIYQKLFPLWKSAKAALSSCKRLIIIGYSFPSTDFLTKKMFLEAFSNNNLEELIIVNDSELAINSAKRLCHFDHDPETFKNLDGFVPGYAGRLNWYI